MIEEYAPNHFKILSMRCFKLETVEDVFKAFPSRKMASIGYKLPIELIDHVQEIFRKERVGSQYKYLYRGPRKHRTDRSKYNQQSNCTKSDATYFSIYKR